MDQNKTHSWMYETLLTISAGFGVALFCLFLLWNYPYFFWHDDYQSQYLPAFYDINRAWQAGEFPLLSPYSWFGGALAGEYQYGVFSVFITACICVVCRLNLSLHLTAAAFSIIHLSVLAAGSFRLARQKQLSVSLAMMVAFVASLNGWMINWGATSWIPALTSFTWLPWAWWAMERSVYSESKGCQRFPNLLSNLAKGILPGIFIYLILTAGWPFTVLMMILLTGWIGIKILWEKQNFIAIVPLFVALIWGIALASPALFMLVEYTSASLRGETASALHYNWIVPFKSLLGLILPAYPTLWNGWDLKQQELRLSIELANGLFPAVMVIASLVRFRKNEIQRNAWKWFLLTVVLMLSSFPSLGMFNHSFRWLPLFHLVLALISAEQMQFWLTENTKMIYHSEVLKQTTLPHIKMFFQKNTGIWAVIIVFIVWNFALKISSPIKPRILVLGMDFFLIALFWTAMEWIMRTRIHIRPWIPLFVVIFALGTTYKHRPENYQHKLTQTSITQWNFRNNLTETRFFDEQIRYYGVCQRKDVSYLGGKNPRIRHSYKIITLTVNPEGKKNPVKILTDGFGEILRIGNTSMFSGIEFINGYTAIFPHGLTRMFGYLSVWSDQTEEAATRVLTMETAPKGLLYWMGVDGLVIGNSMRSEIPTVLNNGWEALIVSDEGVVLHRKHRPTPRIHILETAEFVSSKDEIFRRIIPRTQSDVPLMLYTKDPQWAGKVLNLAPVQFKLLKEKRSKVTLDIEVLGSNQPAVILFSRPWYPGYRAKLDSKTVPVAVFNAIMPAVILPAGVKGQLSLEYRPISWVLGSNIAMVTLFFMVGLGSIWFYKRRTNDRKTL